MEEDKNELVNQLFKNLSEGSNIAHRLEDHRFVAVLSSMGVLLYNDQQNVLDEIFTYFQKDIISKVEQPKQKGGLIKC